ncbi:SusC/RagA family TonB-linked outer membrane protein [Pedobacter cryophilus]|uniref:SusC/RagA family TonB-linked outer membrane protein n=1 Tax=Pedobacter cryophilus TaxID=2571271 RepID=A0A4U1C3K3_9SPHI|nr:SusC/RagA family TonB-linked outer membrane protein [Pedobacter cryophilus]TKC00436.1 SusC/RagA family TonB-linked outer membrane protein [Pedobacter cryophilus]
MTKKLLLILLLFGIYTKNLKAQTRIITGTVTDKMDGSSLPGVAIMVVGSNNGIQTSADGKFSLKVPTGAQSLKFTYVGYLSKTLTVTGNVINVALEQDSKQLSEIVVTGYGTQRKADNVGSIARVSSKELENKPVQSFDQALGGKAAGVQITIPNGVLNNPPVIRIRGTNSISLSSFPLIVIDGIATFTGDASGSSAAGNALASINPNDIESIDVLKDAAAAAIYGSRAANGVLIVTTKKGKSGKATVSYDAWVGSVKPRNLEPLLDAFQYTDLKNEALKNFGTYNTGPTGTRAFFALTNDASGNPINTNWYDYIYREGFSHSNTVSISGGNESTSYYLSGNFTAQEGIIVKNDYNRKSGLFKIDHKEGKMFLLGGKISYTNQENLAATSSGSLPGEAFGTGGLGRLAIVTAPNVAPLNPDGSYSIFNATTIGRMGNVGSDVGFYNPSTVIDLDRSNNELNTVQSNFYLQANLTPWLNLKTVYGIDYILSDNDAFFNPINGGSAASLGSAAKSLNKNKRWVWTNTAQADYTFSEKHNFSLLLGNEQQRSESDGFSGSRTTLSDLAFDNYAAGFATPATAGAVGENYLVSFFSRFNYDFNKKYFLTANLRQDEYSAFGANNKKGIFYGVGIGWEIAQEKFWTKAGLDNLFTTFKIRGSYGTIGNFSGLGNLASYSFYGTGLYAGASTLVPTQTGNDQIGWETSDKLDVGFNFGILNDKITVEAAYYKNSLGGLIYNVPQVPSAGLPSTPQINIASMYNKGYELTVNADPVRTNNFSWNTSLNISFNENKITSLSQGIDQFLTTTSGLESASISRVGSSLGMIYAVPTAGVDPATGRRIFIEKATGKKVLYSHNITTSGFLRWSYEDGTAAPVISINDAQVAGNTQPKFVGGFSNNFRYKKFDLTTTLTYQLGFSIYYGTNAGLRDQRFWNNSTDMLRRWTTPGQITDIPKLNFTDNVSNGSSFPIDVNIYKGDFVKLRNISLGYTLPTQFLSKAKISSARLYVSGDNLLILTKYPGSDPEVSSNGNSTSSLGVERNSVANGRTLTAGLSLKF